MRKYMHFYLEFQRQTAIIAVSIQLLVTCGKWIGIAADNELCISPPKNKHSVADFPTFSLLVPARLSGVKKPRCGQDPLIPTFCEILKYWFL